METQPRMLLEKAFALRCLGPKKRGSIMSDIPNSSTWCCDEILKTIEHMVKIDPAFFLFCVLSY